MSKLSFLKQLSSQLTDALPAQLGAIKKDFERNCHRILSNTFEKFDLVTREQFDVQKKVLQRTRKKIEELEDQLSKLETLMKDKSKK